MALFNRHPILALRQHLDDLKQRSLSVTAANVRFVCRPSKLLCRHMKPRYGLTRRAPEVSGRMRVEREQPYGWLNPLGRNRSETAYQGTAKGGA